MIKRLVASPPANCGVMGQKIIKDQDLIIRITITEPKVTSGKSRRFFHGIDDSTTLSHPPGHRFSCSESLTRVLRSIDLCQSHKTSEAG